MKNENPNNEDAAFRKMIQQVPPANRLIQTIYDLCSALEFRIEALERLRDEATEARVGAMWQEEVTKFDIALGRGLFGILGLLKRRLKQNQSADLFVDAGFFVESLCDEFPRILDGYVKHANDDLEYPENLLGRFAETVIHLTGKLESLSDTHFRALRPVARDYPYWPVLRLRHGRGKKEFEFLADNLELGRECCIRSSKDSNYSLRAPLTGLVWQVLNRIDTVHRIIRFRGDGEEPEGYLTKTWDRFFEVKASPEMISLFAKSFAMPSLRKSNAALWASEVVIPYLLQEHKNLQDVPALKAMNLGPRGKRHSALKKPITQALRSLARRDEKGGPAARL